MNPLKSLFITGYSMAGVAGLIAVLPARRMPGCIRPGSVRRSPVPAMPRSASAHNYRTSS
ncbi:hypothetical protein [Nevskia ramosa]|uniref:hypothetical protein n=1 Tax=Nevskia ramosa TaxID=64002 RepID=UPI0012EB109B|nr:hypothetical protein [Nevskia ramosa]